MTSKKITYYDPKKSFSITQFQQDFLILLQKMHKKNQPLVLICVGSDRATGDCLGPIVGQFFKNSSIYSVYGTLQVPIHAKNINTIIKYVYNFYEDPFIIAIDSCLGFQEHIGYVTLSTLPLAPGQGVCKNLSSFGNLSITGIVDIFSESDPGVIQTTRLKTVMDLASFIINGIQLSKSQASYLHL